MDVPKSGSCEENSLQTASGPGSFSNLGSFRYSVAKNHNSTKQIRPAALSNMLFREEASENLCRMLNQSLFSIVILLRATVSEATITVGILDVIFAPVKGGGDGFLIVPLSR